MKGTVKAEGSSKTIGVNVRRTVGRKTIGVTLDLNLQHKMYDNLTMTL